MTFIRPVQNNRKKSEHFHQASLRKFFEFSVLGFFYWMKISNQIFKIFLKHVSGGNFLNTKFQVVLLLVNGHVPSMFPNSTGFIEFIFEFEPKILVPLMIQKNIILTISQDWSIRSLCKFRGSWRLIISTV